MTFSHKRKSNKLIHKANKSSKRSHRNHRNKKGKTSLKNMCGGGNAPPDKKNFTNIVIKLRGHSDISRLGSEKIVATPHSGDEPRKFLDLWQILTKDFKEKLTNKYFGSDKTWKLGVFVYHDEHGNIPEHFNGNIIIFYIVQYLELLATASNKSIEDLLNILAVAQPMKSFNMDLIKIAFGDNLEKKPLNTQAGKEVFINYLTLLNKYEENSS